MATKIFRGLPKRTKAKVTKIQKINKRIKNLETKTRLAKAQSKSRQASLNARLQSRNPIVRKIAEHEQLSQAKQGARLRELEAKVQTKELKPEVAAEQAKTDSRIKIAKAQSKAKFAGYAAIAHGASQLGKGLAEENNQDDEAERKHSLDIIRTITDGEDDSEGTLKQGVM